MKKTKSSTKKAVHSKIVSPKETTKEEFKQELTKEKNSESNNDSKKESKKETSSVSAWVVVGIVILAVVIGGLVLFNSSKSETTTLFYNDIPFAKEKCPGTNVDCYFASLVIEDVPFIIPFENYPADVEDILFEYPVLDMLRATRTAGNATVIIGVPDGSSSEVGVAGAQLSRILGSRYGILNMSVVARIIGTGEGQVDCRYAGRSQYVVLFVQGTPEGVFVKDINCVEVRAETAQRLTPVVDAFTYRILGVIPTYRSGSNPTKSAPITN